jgi:endoglucanase
VWSPAGNDNAIDFYPGDDVVDYVGVTVLGDEGWDAQFGLPRQSFEQILQPRYDQLQELGKPVIVAEAGVSGTPQWQHDWLEAASESLDAFPLVRGVVYFDAQNPAVNQFATRPDWRLTADSFGVFAESAQRLGTTSHENPPARSQPGPRARPS